MKIIFHGGCNGCTRQETENKGVDFCISCQYFEANWNLPNLNNAPPDAADIARKQIKGRALKAQLKRIIGA